MVNQICDLIDSIKPLSNGKSCKELINFVDDRPGHDFRYAINSSKIKDQLNWDPKETLESGLKKTVLWYIENEKWWKSLKVNMK